MKRLYSVLMICALLMAGLTSFVGAEGAVPALAITVDQTSVKQGDTVTATVRVEDYPNDSNKSWAAMSIKVTYDPNLLSFVKETGVSQTEWSQANNQTVVPGVDSNGIGTILITWFNADGISAADPLVQLTFTALAEASGTIISAQFTEDGQAVVGSSEPIKNNDGSAFSSAVVPSEAIKISPTVSEDNTTITEAAGNRQNDVTATYSIERKQVYLIDITWGELAFTYTDADEEWDEVNHKWVDKDGVKAEWTVDSTDGDKITVTNHSSQPVNVAITSDKTEATPKVTVTNGTFTLQVAPEGLAGTANTAQVKVENALSADHVPGTAIATITVTIK